MLAEPFYFSFFLKILLWVFLVNVRDCQAGDRNHAKFQEELRTKTRSTPPSSAPSQPLMVKMSQLHSHSLTSPLCQLNNRCHILSSYAVHPFVLKNLVWNSLQPSPVSSLCTPGPHLHLLHRGPIADS
ncbi:hypothetical protein V8F33_011980 [Rhypophila sp. PSN 637]